MPTEDKFLPKNLEVEQKLDNRLPPQLYFRPGSPTIAQFPGSYEVRECHMGMKSFLKYSRVSQISEGVFTAIKVEVVSQLPIGKLEKVPTSWFQCLLKKRKTGDLEWAVITYGFHRMRAQAIVQLKNFRKQRFKVDTEAIFKNTEKPSSKTKSSSPVSKDGAKAKTKNEEKRRLINDAVSKVWGEGEI